jgi:hypothetical protein
MLKKFWYHAPRKLWQPWTRILEAVALFLEKCILSLFRAASIKNNSGEIEVERADALVRCSTYAY